MIPLQGFPWMLPSTGFDGCESVRTHPASVWMPSALNCADDGLLGDGGVVIRPKGGRDFDASRTRRELVARRWRVFCS